jgi:hypothetical protein
MMRIGLAGHAWAKAAGAAAALAADVRRRRRLNIVLFPYVELT